MDKKSTLENYLSVPRLKPYLKVCNEDVNKGLEFYQLNMRLGASFFPLLSLLEVSLRNAIDKRLIDYFGKYYWWNDLQTVLKKKSNEKLMLLEKKYGEKLSKDYKNKELLNSTADKLKSQYNSLKREEKRSIRIEIKTLHRTEAEYKAMNDLEKLRFIEKKLEERLKIQSIFIPKSRLIASMNFGFWTSLFQNEIAKALNNSILEIFSHRPKRNKKSGK
ncbi:MAG: hypothetical protein AAGG68_04890 [Bacteroidota bacterium]